MQPIACSCIHCCCTSGDALQGPHPKGKPVSAQSSVITALDLNYLNYLLGLGPKLSLITTASLGTKHPNNNKNCPAPWAANAVLGAFFNKPLRGGAFLGHYGGIPAPAPLPLLAQWGYYAPPRLQPLRALGTKKHQKPSAKKTTPPQLHLRLHLLYSHKKLTS